MSYRASYRSGSRTALKALPRFAGFTFLEAWAGTIDAKTLPVMGIVTPSETIAPASAGQFERGTILQVVVKRQGGDDLEEVLDADAAAIEAAVMGALYSPATQCFPTAISTTLDGESGRRVGTLLVDFRITSWRPAP